MLAPNARLAIVYGGRGVDPAAQEKLLTSVHAIRRKLARKRGQRKPVACVSLLGAQMTQVSPHLTLRNMLPGRARRVCSFLNPSLTHLPCALGLTQLEAGVVSLPIKKEMASVAASGARVVVGAVKSFAMMKLDEELLRGTKELLQLGGTAARRAFAKPAFEELRLVRSQPRLSPIAGDSVQLPSEATQLLFLPPPTTTLQSDRIAGRSDRRDSQAAPCRWQPLTQRAVRSARSSLLGVHERALGAEG